MHQYIQNGLKNVIFREKIQNKTKSFNNTYFYVSEHSEYFFLIYKNFFSCGQGVDPPLLPPWLYFLVVYEFNYSCTQTTTPNADFYA